MRCINCKNEMIFFFEKKGFRICKCFFCSLMAVENIPEDLSGFYSKGYFTGDVSLDGYMDYDHDKEVTKKTYYNFLNDIEGLMSPGLVKSMFEVGCATGFFLKIAGEKGFDSEGIDISEYAVNKAKERGLNAGQGTLDDYTSNRKFGVVVMQDVIEHVKDPVGLIKKSSALLPKDGLLALTTPDAGSLWARIWGKRWHAFVPPQHLYYFSSSNLSSLLTEGGFEVVYLEHHGKWFTVPYIVRLLYSWTGLKFLSSLASLLSKTFVSRISVPINVRDTIYIIAKKK